MKLALIFCIAFTVVRAASGCGLIWNEPRSKIEGCDEQGYVSIAEKLAELSIPGEDRSFPVYATFESSRQKASAYGGMGWSIPFLESNLIQLSEDLFVLTEPGGWKRIFRRMAKTGDILNGGGGWKGQLSPDRATLWADCGWRLDFYKGKIVQMKTPHGQTISYNYTDGRVSSVVCGMKTLIAVDADETADHKLGITIDGKKCYITKSDQTRVERVAGVNVIGGNDPSFSQLFGNGKQTRTFSYSVDDRLTPTLTITDFSNQTTILQWDPVTKRITSYGDWKYNIKPGETPLDNAAISRTNANGQSESWQSDPNGTETSLASSGIKTVTSWFVSGPVAGKRRSVTTYLGDKPKRILQWAYDEKGRLLRTSDGEETIRNVYFGPGDSDFYTQKEYEVQYEQILKTKLEEASKSPQNFEDKSHIAFSLASLYISQGRPKSEIDAILTSIEKTELRTQIKTNLNNSK